MMYEKLHIQRIKNVDYIFNGLKLFFTILLVTYSSDVLWTSLINSSSIRHNVLDSHDLNTV